MNPALAVPEAVEERIVAILFGGSAGRDADAAIRELCAEFPQDTVAIERLVAHLHAQVADMQRRLGAVWKLSRTEGRYQMLEELGRGGLGTVSIARDRMLGRRVALKTIHPRHGVRLHEIDPIKVHRFLDEAQIAAQLQHPGIPPVHDLGIGQLGVPYYTMRYVRGQTLGQWLHLDGGEPRAFDEIVRVLLAVAEALAYAHGRQVLHRDVKPANVLIGHFGEVCVIDWGLARAIPAGSSAGPGGIVRIDRKVDLFSSGLGSEGFLAPEQRRGEFHPASDVFSLAAILHLALVGVPPLLHTDQEQYTVPRAAARQDRQLAAICQRGVAPRLQDRYPDMKALASDLRAYLANRRPTACRPSLLLAATLGWRRSRRWLANRLAGRPMSFPAWLRRPAARRAAAAPPAANAGGSPPPATQLTIATLFPGARDVAGDATMLPARRDPKTMFEQRIDVLRQLSTPMERFAPREVIGEGGMAVIACMEDGLLRRRVAVKTPRPQVDRAVTAPRMLDEAQIAAQLDHPAVLTVHELGVDANGQVRMVMPLVPGGRLDQFLAQHPGQWRQAASFLLQAAWGLAFAHQKGVVHRDVKPANIVIGEHGDSYLADWGIAMLVDSPTDGESKLRLHRGSDLDRESAAETVSDEMSTTVHGTIVGTPAYMAPEMLSPERFGLLGAHSDVWSLGVVLYEVLSGQHPYLDRVRRASFFEIPRLLAAGAIRPLRRVAPRVPRALADVCNRALQQDPSGRLPDAGMFATALAAALPPARD